MALSNAPLLRLYWFGVLCPCHESDEEHFARLAVGKFSKMPIQWRVHEDMTLPSTLTLVDTDSLGPCLQLTCTDPRTHEMKTSLDANAQELRGKFLALLSLSDFMDVVLVDEYWIQVYGPQPSNLVLQFHAGEETVDVVEFLRGIWRWDCARREDLEDARLRREAAMRWREENSSLVTLDHELT